MDREIGADSEAVMNHAIVFNPLIPWPQIFLLTLAAVCLSAWLYRTRRNGERTRVVAALRLAGILALMLILCNPVLTEASRGSGKPPLIILFDTSRSMKTRDADGQSRFDAGKTAALGDDTLTAAIARRFDVRLFSLADTATRQDPAAFLKTAAPVGDHTEIGESMATALSSAAGEPRGGILVVSDGRNNGDIDPVEVARQAKTRHFPVFTMTLGTATHGRDVSVFNRRPQVFAAPDQTVPLSAEIRSVGYGGQQGQVSLNLGGHAVQTRAVTLDDHHPVTISFDVRQPKEGSFRYSLVASPMSGEAVATNNSASIFLQVLKSHARVLVLEARPSWDVKFLIQALHTDPSIDVDAVFKLSPDKTFAVAGASDKPGAQPAIKVPHTAADFAKYDVVVIGRGYEDFFDAASTKALKSFVADHAGNVVFVRGNPGDVQVGLKALEPLTWTSEDVADIRMKVTDEGKRNPAFDFPVGHDPDLVVQKLPNLISATKVEGESALSVVLARSANGPASTPGGPQEMAVLAYQNYGQGKTVALAGQGLWRWALLPPNLSDYGGCYNDFWTQLIRWLVNQSDFLPGQDVSLKTDKTSYAPGQTVNLMAFVRGKSKSQLAPVTILMPGTSPSGKSAQVSMARGGKDQADFVGSFRVKTPGEYLAQMSVPGQGGKPQLLMVPFSVYPDQEEDLITAADPELMRMIADAGGGEVLTTTDISDLPAKLREAQAATQVTVNPKAAWDKPWVLAIILGLFCVEWVLRRRWGMI